MLVYITPVPKPRQTQSDRWRLRPAVMRYRAFCDELRLKTPGYTMPASVRLVFGLPMPKSWSKKKQAKMLHKPHQVRPDTDNLTKAVKDALCSEDSYIWHESATKIWASEGFIIIEEVTDSLPF